MSNVFLDGLQRPAILNEGIGIPDPSQEQDGKVLTTDDGKAVWADAPSELPEIAVADEGKVLTVDNGEASWEDAPSGLPSIAVADAGKVLTVNDGGTAADWETPSGGSGLPEITNSDEGKVLTVVASQTETQNITIVPSQTVTVGLSTTVNIDNAVNLDDFAGGATLVATIDGHDYSGIIEDTGNPVIIFDNTGGALIYIFSLSGNTLTFQAAGLEVETQFAIEAHVAKPILIAGWKAADGFVNLDVIATEVQSAVMTAVGNATTSGFFGVSLSMTGDETTVEIANLITEAARAGKISALNQNLTLTASFIDDTNTPIVEGMEAYTSISFVIPFIAMGFTGYAIAVQIGTSEAQQTEECVPTMAISCWAMKLANYPNQST